MKNGAPRNFAKNPSKGISAALASAFFLGMAPIFGKQAILNGLSPMAVVALRTTLATLLLFLTILIFRRKYLYIYPAGLLGCLIAGGINGIGSLFYYNGLGRIDASLGHMLYMFYPFFVAIWLWLDRQPLSRLTIFRLVLILPTMLLMFQNKQAHIDPLGVLYMLLAAAFYALHLPINQRVLYDMPAPTVTLYTLLAMSLVVIPASLLHPLAAEYTWVINPNMLPAIAYWSLLGLTIVTFFSRLSLFLGVKHLGGMQTSMLGLGELLVTLAFSNIWLGERFNLLQWLGAGLLVVNLFLVGLERNRPQNPSPHGWLRWVSPAQLPTDIKWHSPE